MAFFTEIFSNPGVDPTQLAGPVPAAGVSSGGVPALQFQLGTVVEGAGKGRWVLCTLVLGSATTLANGQAYVIDRNFTATLLTTSNSPRGSSVGFGSVSQASVAAGTYYIWLQIFGHAPVQFTGSAAAAAETTATGGLTNYNNTPTSGAKTILGLNLYVASQTFTATVTNGTFTLTNVSSFNDIAIGATLAGTGVGSGAKVTALNPANATITVDTVSTATGAPITVTQTGVITANVTHPTVGITN